MQGGTIKSIVIFVLLAIFAFIAGSFVTDGLTEALIPTVMIVGAFGLMALGKNSWWLLFLAPPVLQLIPIAALQNFPVAYFCCGLVLAYWVLMSLTGQVRLTWQGVKWLDIVTLVLFTYFLSTWVRHPVTIKAFSSYTDEGEIPWGGYDYMMCVGAIVFYVAVSAIPMKLDKIATVMKYAFWLTIVIGVFLAIKQVMKPSVAVGVADTIASQNESVFSSEMTSRTLSYMPLGMNLFKWIIANYSICSIVITPWKLFVVSFGFVLVLIGGFRLYVVYCFVFLLCASYYKKQLSILVLILLSVWGGLVLLSQTRVIESFPVPIQRSFSAVPCVEVMKWIEDGAQESSEWRYRMWEWALNPREGLIKDYIWGDGFVQYGSDIRREAYLKSVGRAQFANKIMGEQGRDYAERGGWHSGWMTAIHRTGYVGLALLTVWLLSFFIAMFRACSAVELLVNKEYIYITLFQIPIQLVEVYIGTAVWGSIFTSAFYSGAILKVVYALARDEGMMKPMFQRKRYVPLMVEANESQPKLRVL